MFDIDSILGVKRCSSKKKYLDASFILKGQSSKTKGPLGSIVGDRVTKQQKSLFRKSVKTRDPFILFHDSDKDGVIDGLDCAPRNPNKHNSNSAPQILWHAGNKDPSERLSKGEKIYAFSQKRFAEGWAEKHNKSDIYQITSSDYDIDDKRYVRHTPQGPEFSDNEYLVKKIESSEKIDD
jgi:hypothetical protein